MDRGHGSCILRDAGFRDELVDIMRESDGEYYEIGDFVVMPNHVHLLMRTLRPESMRRVCRRWKNLSARAFNQSLGRRGRVWQPESFDHIVRSPQRLRMCQEYIRRNPEGLCPHHYTLGCGKMES
jgi:type I restriction enzyme R subunit